MQIFFYFVQKKETPKGLDWHSAVNLAARVLCVVRVAAHFPQIGFHRLLTGSGIFLREEVLLVGSDELEVTLTRCNSCTHCGEAGADCCLFRSRLGRTYVRFSRANVETRAVRVLRRSDTVGRDDVVSVVVTIHHLRLSQATGNGFDTGSIGNNCHSS